MNLDERARLATEELLSRTDSPLDRFEELQRTHVRRTRTRIMLVSLSVVLALVVGGLVLGRQQTVNSPIGPPSVVAPSASAALPEGVVASIPVESSPSTVRLIAMGGSLWVGGQFSRTVSRIDPATNTVVQTVDVGQETCPLSEAFGLLFAGPCQGDTTAVVDVASGSLRGNLPDAANPVVAADGSIWIGNNAGTALKRIDPATLEVQKTWTIGSGLLAFDGTNVWVGAIDLSNNASGKLAKIDPVTNKVVAHYTVAQMPFGGFMTYGFGALWFKPSDTAMLQRFDITTGKVSSINVPGWRRLTEFDDQPVAVGAGSLWIRTADGVISRIDPVTLRIVGRYRADPAGAGGHPLIAFDSLWVANYGTNTVWRLLIRSKG